MATTQETISGTGYALDNVTYDLVTVLHEKSKGLEAFDRYLKDAQGNQKVSDIFQQIKQQDTQACQQLLECLKDVISK